MAWRARNRTPAVAVATVQPAAPQPPPSRAATTRCARTPPQSSDAVNKSREASQIASQVLDGVLTQVLAGKRPVELCAFGDALIEKLVAPLYKTKKSVEKGVAFPTCISVNNCVAHYSPLESEDKVELKEGDVVKMCVLAAACRSANAALCGATGRSRVLCARVAPRRSHAPSARAAPAHCSTRPTPAPPPTIPSRRAATWACTWTAMRPSLRTQWSWARARTSP